MQNGDQQQRKVWTKPEIRNIYPTDEILARLADASGIPIEELRSIRDRGHVTRKDKAA